MIINHFRYIVSTRITNFYIILINYFSKGVITLKMFVYQAKKIFLYIDIREFAKSRVKPDNISTSVFINIFAYFIHIYIIIMISSIVSIFGTIVSYIIAPIFVISVGF